MAEVVEFSLSKRRPDPLIRQAQVGNKPINAVLLLPDGNLVVACEDGTLSLWNDRLENVGQLSGHDGPVNDLSLSPDGRHFVTASDDRTVGIWETGSRQLSHQGVGHGAYVRSVACTNTRVVSASNDKMVRIFDLDGHLLHEVAAHRESVDAITVVGEVICSASRDNAIYRTDLRSGAALDPIMDAESHVIDLGPGLYHSLGVNNGVGHQHSPSALRSVDGYLVSAATDGVIWWNKAMDAEAKTFEHQLVECIGVDGSDLFVGASREVFWLHGGQVQGSFPANQATAIETDDNHLYVGDENGMLAVLDRHKPVINGHTSFVESKRISDGVVTSDHNGLYLVHRLDHPTVVLPAEPHYKNTCTVENTTNRIAVSSGERMEVFNVNGSLARQITFEPEPGKWQTNRKVSSIATLGDDRWVVGFSGYNLALVGNDNHWWFDGFTKSVSEIYWLGGDVIITRAYFAESDVNADPDDILSWNMDGWVRQLQAWSLSERRELWRAPSAVPDEVKSAFLGPIVPVDNDRFVARPSDDDSSLAVWNIDGSHEVLTTVDGNVVTPAVHHEQQIWFLSRTESEGRRRVGPDTLQRTGLDGGSNTPCVALPEGTVLLFETDRDWVWLEHKTSLILASATDGRVLNSVELGQQVTSIDRVGEQIVICLRNGEILWLSIN